MATRKKASRRTTALPRLNGRLTVSVTEAAAVLGVGRSTLYAAAASGEIPTIKVGSRVLVPVDRLKSLVNGDAGER